MRLYLIPVLLFATFYHALGQASATCTYTDERTGLTEKLAYVVSNSSKNEVEFTTDYTVIDRLGYPFKVVKVVNDVGRKIVNIAVRELRTGKVEEEYSFRYTAYSGLIGSDNSDTLTPSEPYHYLFLISFEDERKHKVNLHSVKSSNRYDILFAPASEELTARNKALLQQAAIVKETSFQDQSGKHGKVKSDEYHSSTNKPVASSGEGNDVKARIEPSAKPEVKQSNEAGVRYHTVELKETLFSIARTYGISVKQLQEWNKLPDFNIKVGQKLIVGH